MTARPARWIVLGLLAVGAWRLGSILRLAFDAYPVATLSAVGLFALYAVPFLLLIGMIDFLQREPVAPAPDRAGLGRPRRHLGRDRRRHGGGQPHREGGLAGARRRVGPGAGRRRGRGDPQGARRGRRHPGRDQGRAQHRGRVRLRGPGRAGLPGRRERDLRGQRGRRRRRAPTGWPRSPRHSCCAGVFGGVWSHALFTAIAGTGIAYAVVRRHRSRATRALVASALLGAGLAVPLSVELALAGRRVRLRRRGRAARASDQGGAGGGRGRHADRRWPSQREAEYYGGVLARLGDPRVASPDEIVALVSPLRADRGPAPGPSASGLGRAAGRCAGCSGPRPNWPSALSREPAFAAGPGRHRRSAGVIRLDSGEIGRRRRAVLVRRRQMLALGLATRWAGGRRRP